MVRHLFISIPCFLLIVLLGCAGYGPSSQVSPSSAGMDISLEELKENFSDYKVYYSAKRHNPSAILFVPNDSDYRLRLDWRWYEVDSPALLNRLLGIIEKIYPRLFAVMTPSLQETGQRKPLAFIYTPAYASLRKTEEPKTYFLRHVPQQPHPDFGSDGVDGLEMD